MDKQRENIQAKANPCGLLTFGNPIFDYIVTVSHEFIKEYNLIPNIEGHHAHLTEENKTALLKRITKEKDVVLVPGGTAINTARVASWLLQQQNRVGCFGAVGEDDLGKVIAESCASVGCSPFFTTLPGEATGACAALVLPNGDRTLVAALGAFKNYALEHMFDTEGLSLALATMKVFYTTAFSLTNENRFLINQHVMENRVDQRIYTLNLSSTTLAVKPEVMSRLNALMGKVDVLFANEEEAIAFGERCTWGKLDEGAKKVPLSCLETDPAPTKEEIALECAGRLASLLSPHGLGLVVITRGPSATLLVDKDGGKCWYPAPSLTSSELVDTVGAGDAFVGGFLAQLMKFYDDSLELRKSTKRHCNGLWGSAGEMAAKCVRMGHYGAKIILGVQGCALPDCPPPIDIFQ